MSAPTVPKPAPPKRVNCPRPDKQMFTTKQAADEKLIEELGHMLNRGWTKHLPTYSYRCSCNFWHWTSRPPRPGGPQPPITISELRRRSEVHGTTQDR